MNLCAIRQPLGAIRGAVCAGLLMTGLAIAAPGSAEAGALTNVQATASSLAAGATNVTYTLRYTTATPLVAGDYLLDAFLPFQVGMESMSGPSNCAGDGLTVTIDGAPQILTTLLQSCTALTAFPAINQVLLQLAQPVAAGSTIVATIPGGTNLDALTEPFFSFETADNSFVEIDGAAPLPLFAPVTVPGVSGWMALGFACLLLGAALGVMRRRWAR